MQNTAIQAFPMSPQQKRSWQWQNQSGGEAGVVHAAMTIKGVLDKERLQTAIEKAVAPYEILRTRFAILDGLRQPSQVIEDTAPIVLETHIEAVSSLEQLPLARFILQAEGPDYRLSLALPAMIGDAFSAASLLSQVIDAYSGASFGDEECLQYADVAQWQWELLESEEGDDEQTEWNQRRQNLDTFRLPFHREGEPSSSAQVVHASLREDTLDGLERDGFDPRHVLGAAWYVLLARMSSNHKVTVACEYDGRAYEELADTIGPLARFLPLALEVGADDPLKEVIGRFRDEDTHIADICEYDRYALEGEQPAYGFSHRVLPGIRQTDGIQWQVDRVHSGAEPFALHLDVCTYEEGTRIRLHYRESAISRDDATHLIRAYRALVRSMADQPNIPLADANLCDEDALMRLQTPIVDTRKNTRTTFLHAFDHSVAQNPEAVALRYGDKTYSYMQLDLSSDHLASRLVEEGVWPGAHVGVAYPDGPELLVSILGIFKAGATYVPIDPNLPGERFQHIVEDSQIFSLCAPLDFPHYAPQHLCHLVVDMDPIAVGAPVSLRISQNQPAYVIYTSGTTGQPKGTPITHGSLYNYLKWVNTELLAGEELPIPATTNPSFDASLKQLLAPLMRGGQVWMLKEGTIADPHSLYQSLCVGEPIGLNCVPTLWRALLDVIADLPGSMRLAQISHLFTGGEAFDEALLQRTRQLFPSLKIINLYGPTEATANATYARIPEQGPVTIGKALTNVQTYVLDRNMQPLPANVPGELYLGGPGLSPGYFNRPRISAERFVPNPFGGQEGARLYRTGDLVSADSSGNLHYLSRADHQVKIRGFRVELGEVEALLRKAPGVSEAVVTLYQREDEKRLAAYLTTQEAKFDTGVVRNWLADRLPNYMIPASIQVLKSFTYLSAGKIDRRALPEPIVSERVYRAPETPEQEALCHTWAQVLKLERVGLDDDFFEIGGHSLLATQLVTRVRKVFRVQIPLRSLFDANTVADMAEILAYHEPKPGQNRVIATAYMKIQNMSPEERARLKAARR